MKWQNALIYTKEGLIKLQILPIILPRKNNQPQNDQSCRVTEKLTNINATDCIFPFKYADEIYYGCSTADNDDKPWCSTKVTGLYDHVVGKGYWGNCPSDCPVQFKNGTVKTENEVVNITVAEELKDFMLGNYGKYFQLPAPFRWQKCKNFNLWEIEQSWT